MKQGEILIYTYKYVYLYGHLACSATTRHLVRPRLRAPIFPRIRGRIRSGEPSNTLPLVGLSIVPPFSCSTSSPFLFSPDRTVPQLSRARNSYSYDFLLKFSKFQIHSLKVLITQQCDLTEKSSLTPCHDLP